MPKSRKRVIQSGAKSLPVRIKHKVGGRKSMQGTGTMSTVELDNALTKCRKRDRNKLVRAIEGRGITLA